MRPKNNKKDLIWIIPELIGVIAILISAVKHISNPGIEVLGLWEWVFQMGLVICVLSFGIKALAHVLNEIKELF